MHIQKQSNQNKQKSTPPWDQWWFFELVIPLAMGVGILCVFGFFMHSCYVDLKESQAKEHKRKCEYIKTHHCEVVDKYYSEDDCKVYHCDHDELHVCYDCK